MKSLSSALGPYSKSARKKNTELVFAVFVGLFSLQVGLETTPPKHWGLQARAIMVYNKRHL